MDDISIAHTYRGGVKPDDIVIDQAAEGGNPSGDQPRKKRAGDEPSDDDKGGKE